MRNTNEIAVWDLLVRIFHWSLVGAFIAAYLSGDELIQVHLFAGYLIGGLLVVRLIWGFVGSRHARFSDFVRGPAAALGYLREMAAGKPARYLGHNPAGGMMIVLLLTSLVVTVVTGLLLLESETGRLFTLVPLMGQGEGGEAWEEVHEFFSNFTVFLVVLHVAGVILGSRLHGENLVRSMVTGRKKASLAQNPE